MRLIESFGRRSALILFLSLLFSGSAFAQATRTWVSGVGDDANPCSRTAPCKTFAGAISKTAASGEINVLDPGGFGAVTITKSITIDGTGTMASVLVSGTNGIVINAAATDKVILRNLAIDGIGSGTNGINIISAKSVDIENVTIFGFTGYAINAVTTNPLNLSVRDVTMRANANGVNVSNTSGTDQNKALLTHVEVSGCTGDGVSMRAGTRVGIANSTFVHNATAYHAIDPATGLGDRAIIDSSDFRYNTTAANVEANTHTMFANVTMTNNITGVTGAGTTQSWGGNILANAAGNGPFGSTVAPQ